MSERLGRIRARLAALDADAAIITHLADIRWAAGFTGSNALLVVMRDRAHFVTDGRYASQAADEVKNAEVHVPGYDLVGHVASSRLLGDAATILVQSDRLTVADLAEYEERLPDCQFVPVKSFLAAERASKDESEVDAIRKAQAVTEKVFDAILPMIAVGVIERDLAAEIVYQHLKRGAERMAFDPIVASGRRGALPHARASSKPLARGELVVIDMGCFMDGYASDMTRTVAIGEPEPGMRRAYDAVLRAQEAAIEAIRPGEAARSVDAVARKVLLEAGLADQFTHSLGHGVGLEVHEGPRLSQHSDEVIPENAVVTVEPGVYLDERFGIRIEDLVVARMGGAENLTRATKELLVF